jgi:hypothetical protein
MNRADVVAALDELAEELRWYRAAIDAGDRGVLERAWLEAQRTLAAVDAVRWGSGTWVEAELEPPSWEGLLALGRRGRAIRRPRVEDGVLRFEATP